MKDNESQTLKKAQMKKDDSDEEMQIDPESKMGTAQVKIEKRTNLKTKTEVEIIFLSLSYNSPISLFKWEITKTLRSFKNLLSKIQFEMANKNLQAPSQRFTYLFSMIAESNYAQLKAREEEIKEFIDLIGEFEALKNAVFLHEYFEVSRHSFIPYNNGIKPKEGYIFKQSEYNNCQKTCLGLCSCIEFCCCTSWLKCWFLLKQDMICYIDNSTSTIGKGTFWFDKGVTFVKDGYQIILRNQKMKLLLKFEEEFERDIWYSLIKWRIETFMSNLVQHEYDSFASEKAECKAKWFIDGEDYFKELQQKLLLAKDTVYITDWWMSPEVYLIRPVPVKTYNSLKFQAALDEHREENLSRLCDVLNHIAKRGVRIYILVYCEFSLALTLNSKHTKQFLVNLDSNINVARHPKTSFDLLWSHHEKLVIIDQRLAFVGGLDLCWGRFDNDRHVISEPENKEGVYMFPGIDYSNGRMGDFLNVENYLKEAVERIHPRMPWHDIHSMLEGPAVLDISRHFVERWNYARAPQNKGGITDIKTKFTVIDSPMKPEHKEDKVHPNTVKYERAQTKYEPRPNELRMSAIKLEDIREEDKNSNAKANADFEQLNFDQVNTLANLHQKLGINSTMRRESHYSKMKNSVKKKMMQKLGLTKKEMISNYVNLKAFQIHFQKNDRKMRCHCLRSLSNWSSGLVETEHSIFNCYLNLIDKAQHYIYIENQFFISKSFTDEENTDQASNLVINQIALRLFLRIKKAFEEKKRFKVIVFIPLLPGFAGEIQTSSTLQVILKYTYKTISRNNGLSIVEKLASLMGDQYKDFISFYSLRQHGIVNGVPRTELIYIHSKLMIVDDLYVIMGSANINDRSMIGERDSEFAVLYKEDPPTFDALMEGEKVKASFFAHTLRMRLWSEHMGVELKDRQLIDELFDPLSPHVLTHMASIAKKNTEVYHDLFNCYPDDAMPNFKDIPSPKLSFTEAEIADLTTRYEAKHKEITGHIVEFPLNFLQNEILQRSFFSAEMLVPIKNFT